MLKRSIIFITFLAIALSSHLHAGCGAPMRSSARRIRFMRRARCRSMRLPSTRSRMRTISRPSKRAWPRNSLRYRRSRTIRRRRPSRIRWLRWRRAVNSCRRAMATFERGQRGEYQSRAAESTHRRGAEAGGALRCHLPERQTALLAWLPSTSSASRSSSIRNRCGCLRSPMTSSSARARISRMPTKPN